MILKRQIKSFIITIAITTAALTSNAGFWDCMTPYQGPDKDIITLVITSNYVKSKLLAELIQNETSQPFILLPSSKDKKIFFCPARGKISMEIREADLTQFIKFTNPKQIIVLGDKKYVPESYLKKIDKSQTVWVVSNKNWNEAAESVEKFLNLNNLAKDFKRISEEYDSGRRYIVKKQPISAEQPIEEVKPDNTGMPPAAIEMGETPVVDTTIVDTPPVKTEPVTTPVQEDKPEVKEPTIKIPESDPVIIKDTVVPK